ncbi:MAG: SpoIIE family protein phosphatase [Planctomycetes bacterium]|nr:SpoIIE family protein phosphatase [Planctomycetota bacterium]MCW8135831.1 SpoIIE family protein phosphatase [Planctomycetota bacterium]
MADSMAELNRARTVQEAMLPDAPRIEGLEIAASYRACDHVGGDFYDFVVVDPGRLGIVMADVAGHGTAAALVMAAAKKALQIYGQGCPSPREALLAANENLLKEIPRGMFVSVFYGVLELANRRFAFSRAGHNPMLLSRDDQLHSYRPDGAVLGVMPSAALAQSLKEESIVLAPGDAVVIYTDGLTEAMNARREMLGQPRLEAALRETMGLSAEAIVAGVRGTADTFRAGAPRNDDEAIIVLRALQAPLVAPELEGDNSGIPGNLPPGTARLIGRDRELNELLNLLTAGQPCVTVTGTAGIGKTRLALGAASLVQGAYRAGVWRVDLSDARDIESVASHTAKALGVELSGGDALERIGHALQGRARARNGRLLLVLDNCDGCRGALVTAIDRWRSIAPGTGIVSTSRTAIGAGGESVYPLRPLQLPARKQTARIGSVDEATARKLAEIPAVALFVSRARERDPAFTLTPENADAIGQLCVRLDGIPLALELAAARVKVLTPRQMLERLAQRFALLRDQRGADARQNTLEGAIAWSWELLNEPERDTLAQLAVCRGGFFLELAEEVVDLSPHADAPLCMDIVESLHDKSLLDVQEIHALSGCRRFGMYESIRAYALAQLAKRGGIEPATARWRDALVRQARQVFDGNESDDIRRTQLQLELEGLSEIARSGEDTNAVWASLMAGGVYTRLGVIRTSLAMLERIQPFAPHGELQHRAAIALAMAKVYSDPAGAEQLLQQVPPESPRYSDALLALGHCYQNRGNGPGMAKVMDKIAALPKLTPRMHAQMLAGRGNSAVMTGDFDAAMQYYAEALARAEKLNERMLAGQVTGNMGVIHNRLGEREQAIRQFNRALELMQTQGHQLAESYWLVNLGIVLRETGKPEEAERHLKRALNLSRENGLREVEAGTLSTLAEIEAARGNIDRAIEMGEQACEIDRQVGNARALSAHLAGMLQIKYNAGRRDGYVDGLRKTVELCDSVGDRFGLAQQLLLLGGALVQQGRETADRAVLEEAAAVLRRSREVYTQTGSQIPLQTESQLAECLYWLGQRDEALSLARAVAAAKPNRGDDPEAITQANALLEKVNESRTAG